MLRIVVIMKNGRPDEVLIQSDRREWSPEIIVADTTDREAYSPSFVVTADDGRVEAIFESLDDLPPEYNAASAETHESTYKRIAQHVE